MDVGQERERVRHVLENLQHGHGLHERRFDVVETAAAERVPCVPHGRPQIGAVAELIEAGWVDLSALPMVIGEPTLEGGRPVDGGP